jgi:hypothetical protein
VTAADSRSVHCEVSCISSFSPFVGRAVTSVASTRYCRVQVAGDEESGWCLAVGGECGGIELWLVLSQKTEEDSSCRKITELESHVVHGSAVRRIRWNDDDATNTVCTIPFGCFHAGENCIGRELKFASGGDDGCVRIFSVGRY